MKKYKLVFTEIFIKDIKKLKKNNSNAYKKVCSFFEELEKHPETGTGKPERLKHQRSGQWSRRITSEHRLIYLIKEEVVEVLLLSAIGHYK